MDSENFKTLSPNAQQRLIAFRNAEEAVTGYQRVLTGSARSSEKSLNLTLKTIPSRGCLRSICRMRSRNSRTISKLRLQVCLACQVFQPFSDIRQQQASPSGNSNNLSRAVTTGNPTDLHQSATAKQLDNVE
jgi:hypothetical protein